MKKNVLLFTVLMITTFALSAQNVGIGNTSPLMTLHISAADSAVALLENTQALIANVSNALYFKTGSGGFPYTGAVKTIGESASAARLGLFTYTSTSPNQLLERLSITDIGDVGIGTINPLTRLHVIKNDSAVALFENTQTLSNNVSTALYFKTGHGALPYTGAIKTIGEGGNLARLGLFTFTSVSGNSLKERMSITDAGNVGIGVTTPQTALHINPNGAGSLLIGTNRASGGYSNLEMGISSQSNGYGYVQATKASGSSYGNLALNPNGGNIGIGTTTPIATMDIHGGIALPIKVVTNDYSVQADDYTIAVDMQHDTNKVLVNIYMPGTLLNHGRIINIITINMDPRQDYHNGKNLINIYDASGNTLLETLEYQEYEEHTYNSNISAQQTYFGTYHTTAVTFQCIGAVAWVITGRVSKEDRVEFTN